MKVKNIRKIKVEKIFLPFDQWLKIQKSKMVQGEDVEEMLKESVVQMPDIERQIK